MSLPPYLMVQAPFRIVATVMMSVLLFRFDPDQIGRRPLWAVVLRIVIPFQALIDFGMEEAGRGDHVAAVESDRANRDRIETVKEIRDRLRGFESGASRGRPADDAHEGDVDRIRLRQVAAADS